MFKRALLVACKVRFHRGSALERRSLHRCEAFDEIFRTRTSEPKSVTKQSHGYERHETLSMLMRALWHCALFSTTCSSHKSLPLRLKHPLNGLNLTVHLVARCNVFWRRAAGKLPPRLIEQHTQVEALQFTAREQERTLQLGQCSMRLLLSSRRLPSLDARLRTAFRLRTRAQKEPVPLSVYVWRAVGLVTARTRRAMAGEMDCGRPEDQPETKSPEPGSRVGGERSRRNRERGELKQDWSSDGGPGDHRLRPHNCTIC
jgi:putative component of membrane protein insertase Oxa1/YidC/SpoIIIJ protein YidD